MRRKWDPVSFRACLPACRDSGVEVLDASSMTDSLVHGNVLSEDGTHVWGFVDVMEAKLILSAMCS